MIDKLLGLPLTNTDLFIISVIFGIFGFFVYWVVMKYGYKNQLMQYLRRDNERNIYFEQYLYRARRQLLELFRELNKIHNEVFGTNYPIDTSNKDIERLIKVICPTSCPSLNKCISKCDLNSDTWVWCETGCASPCPTRPLPLKTQDDCTFRNKPDHVKPLAGLAGVFIIVFILLAVFASHVPAVTLVKSPTFQALEENQTVTISVAITNLRDDTLTHILIEDEVPYGFILMNGTTTSTNESLELGEAIYMDYTLRSLQAGTFALPPAKASYLDSHGTFQEIKSKASLFKVLPGMPTSLPGGEVANLSKSVYPDRVGENQTLVVLLTFRYTGTSTLSNLTITDNPPQDFEFVGGSTSGNFSSIKSGEERSIRYSIRSKNAGRFILDSATATFNNIDQPVKSGSPEIYVVTEFNQSLPLLIDNQNSVATINKTEIKNLTNQTSK